MAAINLDLLPVEPPWPPEVPNTTPEQLAACAQRLMNHLIYSTAAIADSKPRIMELLSETFSEMQAVCKALRESELGAREMVRGYNLSLKMCVNERDAILQHNADLVKQLEEGLDWKEEADRQSDVAENCRLERDNALNIAVAKVQAELGRLRAENTRLRSEQQGSPCP